MSKLVFRTVHGSHLYGLAHADSDMDFYEVYVRSIKRNSHTRATWAKQSIVDGVDTTKVDFGTWMEQCRKGVPQALEAMFSGLAEVDEIDSFRNAFRVGTGAVETYLRTIKAFCMDEENPSFKKRRHAVRLAYNCNTLREYGRFNPTMTEHQIMVANKFAAAEWVDPETLYRACEGLAMA